MTTRDIWLALATRCETATGPDRLLDLAIHCVLTGKHIVALCGQAVPERVQRLTNSLDAITALIERELPGAMATITVKPNRCHVALFGDGFDTHGIAPTEALARCAAFCRAKAEGAQ